MTGWSQLEATIRPGPTFAGIWSLVMTIPVSWTIFLSFDSGALWFTIGCIAAGAVVNAVILNGIVVLGRQLSRSRQAFNREQPGR